MEARLSLLVQITWSYHIWHPPGHFSFRIHTKQPWAHFSIRLGALCSNLIIINSFQTTIPLDRPRWNYAHVVTNILTWNEQKFATNRLLGFRWKTNVKDTDRRLFKLRWHVPKQPIWGTALICYHGNKYGQLMLGCSDRPWPHSLGVIKSHVPMVPTGNVVTDRHLRQPGSFSPHVKHVESFFSIFAIDIHGLVQDCGISNGDTTVLH